MIELLHPDRDAARIAELRSPSSGFDFVDAWPTVLPELARIDDPSGAAEAGQPDAGWIEQVSRYAVYPWRRTMVRLPEAELFRRLRTARNRYLISEDEQRAWSSALIGIAGLSVGAAALMVCGLTGACRFRLAEYDTLGPTNLNRLFASVCDLGVAKLTLAQRRSVELDPYVEITPFPHGYRPATPCAFLGGNGIEPLAVLIEEMDDIAMKVAIRVRARALRIPVVMATDNGDNAILDVERYDLEPERPLFHGLAGDVAAIPPERLRDPARRVELASAIVGGEITERTRYSLSEVGRSIPSWPQLGTAATLAGSIAAYAARMIVCGFPVESGRYRLDQDTLLGGQEAIRPGSRATVRRR